MVEKSKIAVRNIRREANEELKKNLKINKFQRMITQTLKKIFKKSQMTISKL